MSRKFKVEKDLNIEGVEIYNKGTFAFEPGVTILTGCNGAGKTSLLKEIERQLKNEKVPVIFFDNYSDGGSMFTNRSIWNNDIPMAASTLSSSEGERIVLYSYDLAKRVSNFINKNISANEMWILIDAIDSGWSIDNICDFKQYFLDMVLEMYKNKELYIVISANTFEMCKGYDCIDVINAKHRKFKTYDTYRKFILQSRDDKDLLNVRANATCEDNGEGVDDEGDVIN